jgi:putative tricarboxylic transport membrane protein
VSGEAGPTAPEFQPSSRSVGTAIFPAVLFMIFVGVLVESGSFSPDASLFPRLISIVAMVSAAFALVGSLRKPATRPGESQSRAITWRDVAISYAGPPLYCALMALLGFWIASAIFLAGLILMLGTRNPFVVFLLTAGTLSLIYVAFELAFSIPLPGGLLFDSAGS